MTTGMREVLAGWGKVLRTRVSSPAAKKLPPPAGASPATRANPLATEWRWRQDSSFRFTEIQHPVPELPLSRHDMKLGRTRWELAGALPLEMTWEEHRAELNAWKPFHNFKYAVFLDQDRPRYLSCSGEPIFDAQGAFAGYQGVAKDITDEWLAQRQRFREHLACAPVCPSRLGIWSMQMPGMQLTWSDEIRAIFQIEPGGTHHVEQVLHLFASRHRAMLRSAFVASIQDGDAFDLQLELAEGPRAGLWIRLMGAPQRDAAGRIVGMHGALEDISDRTPAAEQSAGLAASLEAVIESLPHPFFALDRGWRFVQVNHAAGDLFGRTREQLLGEKIWAALPDGIETTLHAELERALVDDVVVEFEDFCATLGLWFRLRACPSPGGLAVTMVDLTAQRTTEGELIRLNAELEERVMLRTAQLESASREMEALAYAVAHDLRAPLAAIRGFSQVLTDVHAGELSGKGGHYLARIASAGKQMEEMTEGLLALACLTDKQLLRTRIDLSAMASQMVDTTRARDPARAAHVSVQPGMITQGDPSLVAHVLGNLIENAWKFSGRQPVARIEVGSLLSLEGEPIYFVKDNGAGFDSAYADRLFQPFRRLHTTAEFKGSGIGLSIAHKVVRLHGGHIWGESSPDQGASFYFTLGMPNE